MKTILLNFPRPLVIFLMFISLDSCSQNSQKKPTVIILATGGTIAGATGSGVQAGYTSGQVTIDAMVNAEETAYFLNLVCKTDMPIVLVGSMRQKIIVFTAEILS